MIRLYNALYSSVELPIYPNQTLLARALRTLSALNGIVCTALIGKSLYSALDICEILVMLSKGKQLAQRLRSDNVPIDVEKNVDVVKVAHDLHQPGQLIHAQDSERDEQAHEHE